MKALSHLGFTIPPEGNTVPEWSASCARAYAPAIEDGTVFRNDPVGAHADRDRVALAREDAERM